MQSFMPGNQIYYFRIGKGTWQGRFTFEVDDWPALWRHPIGLKNREAPQGPPQDLLALSVATRGVKQVDARLERPPNQSCLLGLCQAGTLTQLTGTSRAEAASFKICLSSDRSATSFFSLTFSFSNTFNRLA